MNSMTGFGRSEAVIGTQHLTLEIKSVNHRYLDLRFRMPSSFSTLESTLAEQVRGRFDRGSFEVVLKQKNTGASVNQTRFVVDELAVTTLLECCTTLREKHAIAGAPTFEFLSSVGKVFQTLEESSDASTFTQDLKGLLNRAADDLAKMRLNEGEKLKGLLFDGVTNLEKLVAMISELAKEQPRKTREKLLARIQQWNLSTPVDLQRLEWEIAFYADRSEISEELQRLVTHCGQFKNMLKEKKPVGRKLDFLTQELHREMNTLGAKANLVEITQLTVEGKTSIEKLREQVQNVE